MPIRYAMIPHPSSNSIATFYTLRMPSKQQLAILKHSCARCSPAITENAAQMIRDEAEVFYTDFNARLFDIVVGTVVSTFYCTILPCLFVVSFTRSQGRILIIKAAYEHNYLLISQLFSSKWLNYLPLLFSSPKDWIWTWCGASVTPCLRHSLFSFFTGNIYFHRPTLTSCTAVPFTLEVGRSCHLPRILVTSIGRRGPYFRCRFYWNLIK